MLRSLNGTFIKSWSVGGAGAEDADTFDFKNTAQTDAADGGHDDWIPILDIGKGTHRPSNQSDVMTENVTLNFSKVDETVAADIWSDFG